MIKFEDYGTKEEVTDAIKQILIKEGFTILQSNKEYFTYMLDNNFANFSFSYGEMSLSSCYKPSIDNGTGAGYKTGFKLNLDDFKGAFNHTIRDYNNSVVFYKDVTDYLVNNYFVFNTDVTTVNGTKKGLEYLDGYFIYKSNKHGAVISKNHRHLFNNFFDKRNDKYSCIFLYQDNKLEEVNHNINLFADIKAMNALKGYILDGINFVSFEDCNKIDFRIKD